MKPGYLTLCGALLAASCGATPIVFGGSSGKLGAQAVFDFSGTTLTIVLANTSTQDVLAPSDVLTALFFDVSGSPTLTPLLAALGPGAAVWWGSSGPAGTVSGEWAYRAGLSSAPGNAGYGISSAGLGIFGPGDLFPGGSNLQGPLDPDGLQYGLTSAGDDPFTGNAAVTGHNALVFYSVIFTLELAAPGPYQVSNVWAQYGTSLAEASVPLQHVAEPGSWQLVAVGSLLALAGRLVRKP